MTGVIIGKVLDVNLGAVIIEDHISRERIECDIDNSDMLDLKIGEQAIFVGDIYMNKMRVKKVEIRKFLDPLYEEDLFDASGRFTLIPLVSNPFTEKFLEYMERRKEEEAKIIEEALEAEKNCQDEPEIIPQDTSKSPQGSRRNGEDENVISMYTPPSDRLRYNSSGRIKHHTNGGWPIG